MTEDCANKNLDETHKDISEHDIETNQYAMKMVIEECLDGHDDDEKKTSEKKVISRVMTENEKKTNRYNLDKVIE